MTIKASAQTIMQRCDLLGTYSEEPDHITRRFATPAMRQVNEKVAAWMGAAGMTVRQDQIGNLIGRYEASQNGRPRVHHPASAPPPPLRETSTRAKTLLLGSHLDTVRDAGKYDGILGVLTALACVERLHKRKLRLPFAIEVLAFADEEGLRFQSTYLGSRVVAGTFDPNTLSLTDAHGVSVAEAIRAFGGDPDKLQAAKRRSDDLLGYCEVHIEQGPVLETHKLPVGVVSAISGQSRITVSFTGEAGHAGTVPMRQRHDALCAAAEYVLAVETLARHEPGLVATVGQLTVQPGASNVIPGHVTLSLDVRHQNDAVRQGACHQLQVQAYQTAAVRDVTPAWHLMQESHTVPCSPQLTQLLSQAIKEQAWHPQGVPVHSLPSGAGHDAVPLSDLTSIAMLFVRCKGGISHHPAESVAVEDVAVALDVLERFLELLAKEQGHP